MTEAWRVSPWPLLLLALLPLSPAHGAEHVLFESPGGPVKDYDRIVQGLVPGDVLIFSDGSRCTLTERLGGAGTTSVWGIKGNTGEPPLARRIPIDRRSMKFVNYTINGYPALRDEGVPTVKVHGSRASEYVDVDRIDIDLTLKEFITSHPLDPAHPDQLTNEFFEFVRKTAGMSYIADFKAAQIVHVRRRGWILVDWSQGHEKATSGSESNVFSDFKYKDPSWADRWKKKLAEPVSQLISEVRRKPACVAQGLSGLDVSVGGAK